MFEVTDDVQYPRWSTSCCYEIFCLGQEYRVYGFFYPLQTALDLMSFYSGHRASS